MTTLRRGWHLGAQFEDGPASPAATCCEPLTAAGLQGPADPRTPVCGQRDLVELSSRACAAASSLLPPVTCASVMTALDARPVTVAVNELGALLATTRSTGMGEAARHRTRAITACSSADNRRRTFARCPGRPSAVAPARPRATFGLSALSL